MGERRITEREAEPLRRAQDPTGTGDQDGTVAGRTPAASGTPVSDRPAAGAADAPGTPDRTPDPAVREQAGPAATSLTTPRSTPGTDLRTAGRSADGEAAARPAVPGTRGTADDTTGRSDGKAGRPAATGLPATDDGTIVRTDGKAARPAAAGTYGNGGTAGTAATARTTATPAADRSTGRGTAAAQEEEQLLPGHASEALEARWHDILVGFVDGPKHSVEEADRLLDEVSALIAEGLKERRRTLRDSWQGEDGTRTEELRLTLQKYRGLVTRLLAT
ncbi:hypothetical protein [Peterkaempfera griseoplana]|uniref:hypothetical protein n=1 Tax=Peterkaempfera griseoplana TaxID=66896 RepID=UPI0006E18189|nr:hypothetical protein [Peterkaempfera griseoplana]